MEKKTLSYLSKIEEKVVKSFVKELREKLDKEIVSIRLFGSKVRGDFQKFVEEAGKRLQEMIENTQNERGIENVKG